MKFSAQLTYFDENGYPHIHSIYYGKTKKSAFKPARKHYVEHYNYEMAKVEVWDNKTCLSVQLFYLNGEIIEDVTKFINLKN